MKVILASASPRRKELLHHIVPKFCVQTADTDEQIEDTDCAHRVQTLALRKAEAIGPQADAVVIGADTLVYAGGEILGKPQDKEDAARMLRLLSGRMHQVYTGVALLCGAQKQVFFEKTDVYFAPISEAELQSYLAQADYMDKAGAYAIQSEAAKFITRIDGCYYNVMGLPVSKLYAALKQLNFWC